MNMVTDHQSEGNMLEAGKLAGPFLLGITGMVLNIFNVLIGRNLMASPELIINTLGNLYTVFSYLAFSGATILAILNIHNITKATNMITK